MKVDEVPQDEGSCYGEIRRLTYAVDNSGIYQGVKTKGWEAEIDTTNVAVESANERIRETWAMVRENKLSPLAYHIEFARMTPSMLSLDSGIWLWRVKRHLKPEIFKGLSDKILKKYAEALGITLDQIKIVPSEPELL